MATIAPGRGRKPKPTAEKIRNGSAAHNPGRLNKQEPAALPDEPAMPDYFGDYAREAWRRIPQDATGGRKYNP
jgi:phage terminase small subunit